MADVTASGPGGLDPSHGWVAGITSFLGLVVGYGFRWLQQRYDNERLTNVEARLAASEERDKRCEIKYGKLATKFRLVVRELLRLRKKMKESEGK